jgi:hypothetical protein
VLAVSETIFIKAVMQTPMRCSHSKDESSLNICLAESALGGSRRLSCLVAVQLPSELRSITCVTTASRKSTRVMGEANFRLIELVDPIMSPSPHVLGVCTTGVLRTGTLD